MYRWLSSGARWSFARGFESRRVLDFFSFLISLRNVFHLEKVPDGGATSLIFLKKCLAVKFEATQAS